MKKLECFNCHGTCGCHKKGNKSMVSCTCPFNGSLTIKKMKVTFNKSKFKEKIIGYIGKFPVIERQDCPPGMIYIFNKEDFEKAMS